MLKTKTAIAYLYTWEIAGSISSNFDVANIIPYVALFVPMYIIDTSSGHCGPLVVDLCHLFL